MPLRRSPRLTSALLEANRRNAQKSTGPRTIRGKQAVRLNRLGTPVRLRPLATGRLPLPRQLELAHIYASPYYAVAPRPCELRWLKKTAAMIWRTKRALEREVREPAFRMREGKIWRLPEPFKMELDRPGPPGRRGWRVSVVMGLRQSRGPTGLPPLPPGWWDVRRSLHVQLVVRCSYGRTWRPSDGPLRARPEPRQAPVTVTPAAASAHNLARNVTPGDGGRRAATVAIKATMFKVLKKLLKYVTAASPSGGGNAPDGCQR